MIVGGTVGYALIDLGVLVPWRPTQGGDANFAAFIACTLVPLAAWVYVFLRSYQQKLAARRGHSKP